MKKLVSILLITFSLSNFGKSQNFGPYKPLTFKNADFIWNHAPIDSSIIGYEDSVSLEFGFSYDGRSHLQFENQKLPPVIDGNFMYLVNTKFINFDAGGFFIEKIDLNTGLSLWKADSDIRITGNSRDYPRIVKIIDNNIVVFAFREFTERNMPFPFPMLMSGLIYGKLVRMEYDKNTGVLLKEYIADEHTTYSKFYSSNHTFIDYDEKETTLKFYKKNIKYTEKITTSKDGDSLYVDTLRTAAANLKWENDVSKTTIVNKIISDKECLYILDAYYSEIVVPDPPQIILSKYNKDGILSYSKPILLSLQGSLGQILFHSITDEFIILIGYEDPESLRNPIYLILDKDGTLIQKIDPIYITSRLKNSYKVCFPNNAGQNVVFFEPHYNDFVKKSWFNVYTLNTNGKLDLLKQIEFDTEGYKLGFYSGWYLENGDILIYLAHWYYDEVEDKRLGLFPNWMRIKPEELGFESTVATDEINQKGAISIHPNPSVDKISIKIENTIYKKGNLKIYDIFGKAIISKRINSNEINLDISNLKAGVYFCSIEEVNSKKTLIETFVKVE